MAQIGTSFTTTPTVDLLVCDTNLNTRGVVQIQGDNTSLNGTLVNYTDYDAYGNPITQAGGAANPGGLDSLGVANSTSSSFGFGGSYGDQSGLDYLVNRNYDPTDSQFISVDPLISQTQQAYSYAGQNPIANTDPTGEKTKSEGNKPTFPDPNSTQYGLNAEAYCMLVTVNVSALSFNVEGCVEQTYSQNSTIFSISIGASVAASFENSGSSEVTKIEQAVEKKISNFSLQVGFGYQQDYQPGGTFFNSKSISDKTYSYSESSSASIGPFSASYTLSADHRGPSEGWSQEWDIGFTVLGTPAAGYAQGIGASVSWTFGKNWHSGAIENAFYWADLINPISPNW